MTLHLTEEEYAELRRRYQQRTREAEAHEAEQSRPLDSRNESYGKPRKYRNQRVTVDGKTFDSKHEAEVYADLMLRRRAGELRIVMRQVPFDLPGGIRYIADFCTVDSAGRFDVLDAKSPITRRDRVYVNKRKQMLSEWGITVKEV